MPRALDLTNDPVYKTILVRVDKLLVLGSVIWVTTEDYLLQYDVMSGEWRTEVLVDKLEGRQRIQIGLACRPSFHNEALIEQCVCLNQSEVDLCVTSDTSSMHAI